MSAHALYRLAAVMLVASGVFLTIGLMLHPMPPYAESIATSSWIFSHIFWWMGALAGIVGLTGLYVRHREAAGISGFVGLALAVSGMTLIACAMYFEAFIAPAVAARAPSLFAGFPSAGGWEGFLAGVLASGALFGVGFLSLGIALARARSVPRWSVLMSVLGGVPFAVNFLLPRSVAIAAVAVFAIGLYGLGRSLWASIDRPAAAPSG